MKKALKSLLLVSFLALMLSALSFFTSAADFEPPVFTSVISDGDSITLTWDKIDGAYGYHLQRRFEDGYFRHVVNTKNNTYTLKDLPSDTTYEFRVRAYKLREDRTKDYGAFSERVFKKTKLPVPQNLAYEAATESSVTVRWDAVEGAESYVVYYAAYGKGGFIADGTTTETSYTIDGLSVKDKYKVRIVAKKKGNTSYTDSYLTLYTAPPKGITPTVKARDGGSITVEWTKAGRENAYNVYVATSAKGEYIKVATTKKRYYKYTAKSPETAYYFRVAPVVDTANQVTEGARSDYKKAVTDSMTIKKPSVIRKGDYPEITVPYYNSKVKWTSSNNKVITLKNGRLFASGKGTATLTATYKSKYKAQVKVTVSSPVVSVKSAVYDHTNGNYIFEQDINSRCYPASITKLITALTVLEYMDPYDTIVVGSELNMVESNSSTCGLKRGEKFRLKDILYGLLVPSGGDAAYTIAVNCARKVSGNPDMGYVKAKDYFAGLMNKYMKSIGATGTNCVNPHGYPKSSHYSTVHDLMLVANKVLENDLLRTITSTKSIVITSKTGQRHSWRTTNSLLSTSSGYYHPNAHGMKTGTVNPSYTGIIAVATKNGRTIITIVIGCPTYNARYDNTHKLLKAYL